MKRTEETTKSTFMWPKFPAVGAWRIFSAKGVGGEAEFVLGPWPSFRAIGVAPCGVDVVYLVAEFTPGRSSETGETTVVLDLVYIIMSIMIHAIIC